MNASIRAGVVCNHAVALPCIADLHASGCLAGLAVPDRLHAATTMVEQIAREVSLPFAQLARSDLEVRLAAWLRDVRPDVVIVIAFPYRIPAALLAVPPLGFFNVHHGLLPAYRGPAPVFWQLRQGERWGGVTVHRMEADFDTGPIAFVERVELGPDETHGLHVQRLVPATRQGVHAVVEQLAADPEGLRLFPQPPAKAASLRRPTAEDLRIDWQQPAVQIKDLVRAANPDYGGATTSVRGVPVALLQATVLALPEPDALPGTVVVAETPKPPVVRCGDGRGLQLDIVASDAGVQTGHRFAATIGLSPGERFI